METKDFENRVKRTLLNKPPTKNELREFINSRKNLKFPYKEVAEKLNNLSPLQVDMIEQIIRDGELSVMKKVGIKKLFGMVKNPVVKDKMKLIYKL